MRRRDLLITTVSLAASATPARSDPVQRPPEPWPRWQAQDASSHVHIDHAAWAELLRRLTRSRHDGMTLVAYAAATAQDRVDLDAYLDMLSRVMVSRLARNEQLAFWSNLYNAIVLRLILVHYPIPSVREIPGFGGGQGPWSSPVITIEEEVLTLNDLEHRILRPIWRDPRIHYAISWAAMGSPCLLTDPINCDRTAAQLDLAATMFVNHPRALTLDQGRVTLSSMYSWFQADFGGTEQNVLRHIMAYARPQLAMKLRQVDRIAGYQYDWRLNEAI